MFQNCGKIQNDKIENDVTRGTLPRMCMTEET